MLTQNQRLERNGTLLLDPSEFIFDGKEWEQIEHLALPEQIPYEHVLIGDAGEPNQVDVARIMTDTDAPKVVNHESSKQLYSLLAQPKVINYFKQLLAKEKLYLRRAQINLMHTKAFIGYHLDTDSNPDYLISVVLQLGQTFEGGDFVVYRDGKKNRYIPYYHSVIVSYCQYPHEVETVTKGKRQSLVFFLSEYDGANRRYDKNNIMVSKVA